MTSAIADPPTTATISAHLRVPNVDDGQHMWTLARDTEVLDLNSSYAYLLWCRDFAATSVIAEVGDEPAGFVTGYLRPEAPDTLMIWQVAVSAQFRGQRLAGTMLDELVRRTGATRMETTITDDNAASHRLFTGLADRHGADWRRAALFTPEHYPDGHDTEYLYEIAPLRTAAA
ncbi:diaminobutyrate acetyltransferase [Brevibacterium daeguense]